MAYVISPLTLSLPNACAPLVVVAEHRTSCTTLFTTTPAVWNKYGRTQPNHLWFDDTWCYRYLLQARWACGGIAEERLFCVCAFTCVSAHVSFSASAAGGDDLSFVGAVAFTTREPPWQLDKVVIPAQCTPPRGGKLTAVRNDVRRQTQGYICYNTQPARTSNTQVTSTEECKSDRRGLKT